MSPAEIRGSIPVVFVSSTAEDLRPYRLAAENAAKIAGFFPLMQEYFAARGDNPPLERCLSEVSRADVLVVIVAWRYGWIPEEQENGRHKSITWLECERAVQEGKEVLAFLTVESAPWPIELREEYRLVKAIQDGTAETLAGEVQRRVSWLREFREWLRRRYIRAEFSSPEDLRGKVSDALHKWRLRHWTDAPAVATQASTAADPAPYLKELLQETGHIDIRGLEVGEGRAHRFPIDELYIPLTSSRPAGEPAAESFGNTGAPHASLEQALRWPKLTIIGDPGCGKTTFLRYTAHCLARMWLGQPNTPPSLHGISRRVLPLLLRVADLLEFITRNHARLAVMGPASIDSPAWLPQFFATRSAEFNWGLDHEFFRAQLASGNCILLLDGLDEAPDRKGREAMSSLIQHAARVYEGNHFVVTARPAAHIGKSALPGPEFEEVRVGDLEWGSIESFLARWSAALFRENPAQAETHRRQLVEAVASRSAIRRLARNPVMLTALAVLHWNNRRLPEHRAELYESIIKWLSQSRQDRERRATPERCVAILQELAKAMQDHPAGRQVQVSRVWAAQAVAARFREVPQEERAEAAERFLREEEIDSGIVVNRGNDIRFWHLTFQEYLAARAISGLPDAEQHRLLLAKGRAYLSEWREVVFLTAGVLHQQGIGKVDALFSAILSDADRQNRPWAKLLRSNDRANLARQARAAGLLGGILQDLGPLRYRSIDPRHAANLRAILGVFEPEQSRSLDFKVRLEAAEALGQAGDPRLSGENWVKVESAASPVGEGAGRIIDVCTYSIGRYPVTVEEFRRFVEDGGYGNRLWWRHGMAGAYEAPDRWEEQIQHANRPVVGVSWHEALAYCEWQGVQLAGDAEWERAAAGASRRAYPWGDDEPDPTRANFRKSELGRPTPVGLYPSGATAEGIHDLAGNVWEWTMDWFVQGESRVVRGGSWNTSDWLLKNTTRFGLAPATRRTDVGFRVQKSK